MAIADHDIDMLRPPRGHRMGINQNGEAELALGRPYLGLKGRMVGRIELIDPLARFRHSQAGAIDGLPLGTEARDNTQPGKRPGRW